MISNDALGLGAKKKRNDERHSDNSQQSRKETSE